MGSLIILLIPIYSVFIWTYFKPKESILWGKRWMYKEEPEISDGAIRYLKVLCLISVMGTTLATIIFIFTQN